MIATAAAEPTTTASVRVIGSRPVWTAAIERVLQEAGVTIRSEPAEESPYDPQVLLLVDPGEAEWDSVRATELPVVVEGAREATERDLVRLVHRGALAVLPATCEEDALLDTIDHVAAGRTGLTRSQVRSLVDTVHGEMAKNEADVPAITKREREILGAIEAGLGIKETAQTLGISPRTVENTQRVLFRKLNVRNRAQLVARAADIGALDPIATPDTPS